MSKEHRTSRLLQRPDGYDTWLLDLKRRVHAAQQRASLAVNREILQLYWQIGKDILERQAHAGWGAGIVDHLAADLRVAFPEMKGFSRSNLKYMRAFAEAWPELGTIGQQLVGQLSGPDLYRDVSDVADAVVQQAVGQLPWGHNVVLLTKLKTRKARLAHAEQAIMHGWSRNALVLHIENRTLERQGKALTNFEERLPRPQSDLARESLKDPYHFDFLTLGAEATEREIEAALVQQMTRFLLELGAGFAFVGRQVHISGSCLMLATGTGKCPTPSIGVLAANGVRTTATWHQVPTST